MSSTIQLDVNTSDETSRCQHGSTWYYPKSLCPVCHPQLGAQFSAADFMQRIAWLESRVAALEALQVLSDTRIEVGNKVLL